MTFTFEDCFVIASRIATARQWFHTWFVVFLKSILSRKGLILEASMIEDCYYFFDFRIQIFERCINAVPQLFDKMCFKIFNMVLYRRFSLGFPCGRRQDDGSIEIFQICKCGLQNQFVLRVLCYSGFQIIRHKILCYSPIKRDCMGTTFNKAWQFFIWKCFGINQAAYSCAAANR